MEIYVLLKLLKYTKNNFLALKGRKGIKKKALTLNKMIEKKN